MEDSRALSKEIEPELRHRHPEIHLGLLKPLPKTVTQQLKVLTSTTKRSTSTFSHVKLYRIF